MNKMLVPQSYRYTSMPTETKVRSHEGIARDPPRSKSSDKHRSVHGRPKMLSSIATPTPSKPVIIPTRTQTPRSRRPRIANISTSSTNTPANEPQSMPASMAALLAVASVQNQRTVSIRRNTSGNFLDKEILSPDDLRYVFSSSSPKSWSMLQGEPDEEESKERDGDTSSVTSASTIAPLSSYRSLSSDSMPSLDMELDLESPASPSPPKFTTRLRGGVRRPKIHSPRASLGDGEHPLSPSTASKWDPPAQDKEIVRENLPSPPSTPLSSPRSPFRSNLTASIRLLKSAARSVSDNTPSNYRPELLPRSDLVKPEPMSLKPIQRRASPPLPFANIDGLPLHFHLASHMPSLPPSTASIQLMPYVPSPLPTSAFATAPPVFLPSATPSATEELDKKMALPRPREPRENSDFLRVVVLEMNMRRVGKLAGGGRARIWLGPRTDGQTQDEAPKSNGGETGGGFVVGGVVGASSEVERDVLQEEGEISFKTTRGEGTHEPIPRTSPLVPEEKGRKRVSEKRQIPSRWIGITP